MIHVGIVGCGSIAMRRHVPGIKNHKEADVCGFFDMSYDRAEDFARTYGGKAYTTYDEMLLDPGIDAVIICTSAASHGKLTIQALEAGKHVLCEKPMCISGEDARGMVNAAKRSGKKLMISHNQRYYEPHMKAKELLDAHKLGKIISFRNNYGIKGPEYSSLLGVNNLYFSRAMSGRGVMSDIGSHRLDIMRYLLGTDYKRVFAYTPTLAKKKPDGSPIEVDDNAFSILEMDDGVVGSMITSWTSANDNDRSIVIYGTEGVMSIYTETHGLVVEYADGSREVYDDLEVHPQNEFVLTTIDIDFIDCIINDTTPPITGEDGASVVLALDAMERSNATGTWVDVDKI